MRTSEHLAAAAGHLAALLREGQHDLVEEPDLGPAVEARDRVAAGLAQALRTVLDQLDALGGHHDAVEAAAPLVPALLACARSAPVVPPGSLPTSGAAAEWVAAASEVEAAARQASQVGPTSATDLRAAGVDLATLAGALADLDTDLTAAVPTAGAPRSDPQARERLQRHARVAVTALDGADLPDQYHLAPPVLGVAPVTEAHLIPIALRRVRVLLDRSPGLTAPQHAAVAMELARLAHHLRRRLGPRPGTDAALRRLTNAYLGLAHVWNAITHVRGLGPGSWDAPAQLHAINRFLTARPEVGLIDAQVVSRLTALASRIAAEFDRAQSREHWAAAYQDATGRMAWAPLWPDYGPASRGETPAVSDLVSAEVHLAGHAVHEIWHDRNLPVEGYRLGDPIEDRRIGSPYGVAELTRIRIALDATIAAGRGLQTTLGSALPDSARSASATATARQVLPASTAVVPVAGLTAVPQRVIAVRRPSDLPDGLNRLAALLRGTSDLSPLSLAQWRQIARTVAVAAQHTGQALYRAGHPAPAAALVEQARLLAEVVQAVPKATSTGRGRCLPLAEAQQIHRQLASLRQAGISLEPTHALAMASALPMCMQALADSAHRTNATSARLQAEVTTSGLSPVSARLATLTWTTRPATPTVAGIHRVVAAPQRRGRLR
ncbi:MAG TPA: hypothetical protein VI248_13435 [Kineosporiaceae bacterium]